MKRGPGVQKAILAAIRRDRDGKTYTGSWHGECLEKFITDQRPEVQEMFHQGEFSKALFEEPQTHGFEIEGEFYDREETTERLNMDEQYAEAGDVAQHVYGENEL